MSVVKLFSLHFAGTVQWTVVSSCLQTYYWFFQLRVQTAIAITTSPSGQSSCVTGTVYITGTGRWGKEGPSSTSSLNTPAMVSQQSQNQEAPRSLLDFSKAGAVVKGAGVKLCIAVFQNQESLNPPMQRIRCCNSTMSVLLISHRQERPN